MAIHDRYYAADVARLAECHPKTVRKLADQKLIPCHKDYNGWRVFSNPEQVAARIKELLTGRSVGKDPIKKRSEK